MEKISSDKEDIGYGPDVPLEKRAVLVTTIGTETVTENTSLNLDLNRALDEDHSLRQQSRNTLTTKNAAKREAPLKEAAPIKNPLPLVEENITEREILYKTQLKSQLGSSQAPIMEISSFDKEDIEYGPDVTIEKRADLVTTVRSEAVTENTSVNHPLNEEHSLHQQTRHTLARKNADAKPTFLLKETSPRQHPTSFVKKNLADRELELDRPIMENKSFANNKAITENTSVNLDLNSPFNQVHSLQERSRDKLARKNAAKRKFLRKKISPRQKPLSFVKENLVYRETTIIKSPLEKIQPPIMKNRSVDKKDMGYIPIEEKYVLLPTVRNKAATETTSINLDLNRPFNDEHSPHLQTRNKLAWKNDAKRKFPPKETSTRQNPPPIVGENLGDREILYPTQLKSQLDSLQLPLMEIRSFDKKHPGYVPIEKRAVLVPTVHNEAVTKVTSVNLDLNRPFNEPHSQHQRSRDKLARKNDAKRKFPPKETPTRQNPPSFVEENMADTKNLYMTQQKSKLDSLPPSSKEIRSFDEKDLGYVPIEKRAVLVPKMQNEADTGNTSVNLDLNRPFNEPHSQHEGSRDKLARKNDAKCKFPLKATSTSQNPPSFVAENIADRKISYTTQLKPKVDSLHSPIVESRSIEKKDFGYVPIKKRAVLVPTMRNEAVIENTSINLDLNRPFNEKQSPHQKSRNKLERKNTAKRKFPRKMTSPRQKPLSFVEQSIAGGKILYATELKSQVDSLHPPIIEIRSFDKKDLGYVPIEKRAVLIPTVHNKTVTENPSVKLDLNRPFNEEHSLHQQSRNALARKKAAKLKFLRKKTSPSQKPLSFVKENLANREATIIKSQLDSRQPPILESRSFDKKDISKEKSAVPIEKRAVLVSSVHTDAEKETPSLNLDLNSTFIEEHGPHQQNRNKLARKTDAKPKFPTTERSTMQNPPSFVVQNVTGRESLSKAHIIPSIPKKRSLDKNDLEKRPVSLCLESTIDNIYIIRIDRVEHNQEQNSQTELAKDNPAKRDVRPQEPLRRQNPRPSINEDIPERNFLIPSAVNPEPVCRKSMGEVVYDKKEDASNDQQSSQPSSNEVDTICDKFRDAISIKESGMQFIISVKETELFGKDNIVLTRRGLNLQPVFKSPAARAAPRPTIENITITEIPAKKLIGEVAQTKKDYRSNDAQSDQVCMNSSEEGIQIDKLNSKIAEYNQVGMNPSGKSNHIKNEDTFDIKTEKNSRPEIYYINKVSSEDDCVYIEDNNDLVIDDIINRPPHELFYQELASIPLPADENTIIPTSQAIACQQEVLPPVPSTIRHIKIEDRSNNAESDLICMNSSVDGIQIKNEDTLNIKTENNSMPEVYYIDDSASDDDCVIIGENCYIMVDDTIIPSPQALAGQQETLPAVPSIIDHIKIEDRSNDAEINQVGMKSLEEGIQIDNLKSKIAEYNQRGMNSSGQGTHIKSEDTLNIKTESIQIDTLKSKIAEYNQVGMNSSGQGILMKNEDTLNIKTESIQIDKLKSKIAEYNQVGMNSSGQGIQMKNEDTLNIKTERIQIDTLKSRIAEYNQLGMHIKNGDTLNLKTENIQIDKLKSKIADYNQVGMKSSGPGIQIKNEDSLNIKTESIPIDKLKSKIAEYNQVGMNSSGQGIQMKNEDTLNIKAENTSISEVYYIDDSSSEDDCVYIGKDSVFKIDDTITPPPIDLKPVLAYAPLTEDVNSTATSVKALAQIAAPISVGKKGFTARDLAWLRKTTLPSADQMASDVMYAKRGEKREPECHDSNDNDPASKLKKPNEPQLSDSDNEMNIIDPTTIVKKSESNSPN